ncbi:MAG: histidinol-phosphate transaminase [Candidatus Firestonebacteria bacterium]
MFNLAKENIVKIKPYIPGKPIDEVKRELGLEDVIKLASNENPLGPSSKALNAIRKVLQDINRYPEGNAFELKLSLSKKIGVSQDHFAIGNGSNELIVLAAEAFLNKSDIVLTSELTFVVYEMVAQLMDANLIKVPMKNNSYDIQSFISHLDKNIKMIFIANPNNPTGTMVTQKETDELLAKISDNTIVVFDEAYAEYVDREDYPDSLKYVEEGKNVIILRTFSKIYGLAGLRVGYAIAKPEIIEVLNKVRQPFNVNSLAQVAALSALKDGKHIAESIKVNSEGKQYLYTLFKELNIEFVPTSANFIFVDLKRNAKEIANRLLQEGIIIREIGETTIRITIGTFEQNEKFAQAFKKLW